MRQVVVVTAHDAPYLPLASLTYPSLEAYCKKHDYNLWYEPDIDPLEKDLCKARIYREIRAEGRFGPDDLCMWIDSDAVVLNHDIKVEDVWDAHADADTHFLWSNNFDGPNSGVWIARFSEEADNFIRVYAYEQVAMGWGDNNAMNLKMMLPPFNAWVKCIPGIYMNAQPYEEYGLENRPREWKRAVSGYEPGDWILHACGIEEPRRTQVLEKYLIDATFKAGIALGNALADEAEWQRWQGAVSVIDQSPVPSWVTLRGLAEALPKARGLHECEDWGIWNAVYVNNEYGIGAFEPDDVVLDIGASTGPFSCLAYANGSRNVIAYEMDAENFAVAQKNISIARLGADADDVRIFNKAVVAVNDRPFSYVPRSMILRADGQGTPAEVVQFDDILGPLKKVRYLKIDIEGAEWDILYGSKQLHKIQEIGGEYHPLHRAGCDPDTLEKFLQKAGFKTTFIVKPGIGDFRCWRE